MPVISGGKVIEGSLRRQTGGAVDADVVGVGPYTSAGVPASGYLNNVAQKGAMVIDTTNGNLYLNGGTLSATVWKLVTRAA